MKKESLKVTFKVKGLEKIPGKVKKIEKIIKEINDLIMALKITI